MKEKRQLGKGAIKEFERLERECRSEVERENRVSRRETIVEADGFASQEEAQAAYRAEKLRMNQIEQQFNEQLLLRQGPKVSIGSRELPFTQADVLRLGGS